MPKAIKICSEPGCKNAQTTKGYCRLHYLKNWKQLKADEKKKTADRLNKYVEGIVRRSPDKYVDEVKRDLKSNRLLDSFGGDGRAGEEDFNLLGDLGLDDDERIDKIVGTVKIDKDFL